MITKELIEIYKKYNADDLLSIFTHKWMVRGFIAWVISAMLFRCTPVELAILLIPLSMFVAWMVRAEWKQYKRWLNSKEGRNQSSSMK